MVKLYCQKYTSILSIHGLMNEIIAFGDIIIFNETLLHLIKSNDLHIIHHKMRLTILEKYFFFENKRNLYATVQKKRVGQLVAPLSGLYNKV